MNDSILFTPASLLDFLSSIDELKDLDVGLTETIDGNIQVQIGSSIYEIDTSNATDVSVDESVVNTIDDVNESTYEELDDNYDSTIPNTSLEDVEGGLIKEALKTLLVGGMVRLGAKLLK